MCVAVLESRDFARAVRTAKLQRRGGESVAVLRPSGLEAALEPAQALRRRAVGKRFRDDAALRLLLQSIVADRARRVQRLLQVVRIELLHRAGVMPPDTGVA